MAKRVRVLVAIRILMEGMNYKLVEINFFYNKKLKMYVWRRAIFRKKVTNASLQKILITLISFISPNDNVTHGLDIK